VLGKPVNIHRIGPQKFAFKENPWLENFSKPYLNIKHKGSERKKWPSHGRKRHILTKKLPKTMVIWYG